MQAWLLSQGLNEVADVSVAWPDYNARKFDAVIVANAANDHVSAAHAALLSGVPVLVEKPFALTADAAKSLINLATARSTRLAAAHVFRFARYIERFGALVSTSAPLNGMSLEWADPGIEHRYGEQKSYDPGLPIVADLLPHIASILTSIAPGAAISCENAAVSRGGASVVLGLRLGVAPCRVTLARDSTQRIRKIDAFAGKSDFNLDFSVEPGTITTQDSSICGDPDWLTERRPLERLLSAFLTSAVGGLHDERLDAGTGLLACELTDAALRHYRAAQASWLAETASSGYVPLDNDLRYALRELLMLAGGGPAPLEDRLNRLWQDLTGADGPARIAELVDAGTLGLNRGK